MSQAGLLDIEASHPQIATSFTTDSGTAIPLANNLEILGGDGIVTSASGKTITVALDIPITVSFGGTGRQTLTDGAVLVGDGTSPVEEISLTNGQLLIGYTSRSPVAANLLAGTGIAITNGSGSIRVSTTGSVLLAVDADSGSCTPVGNRLNVNGTSSQGISTSAAGSTLTLTIADATTSQKGVLETATDAEAVAVTATDKAVTPSNLDNVFAEPPALGGTTPSTGKLTYLDLVGAAAPSYSAGRIYYDSSTDTMNFYNAESEVALNIGEENWIKVRNETGSTITNGQIVYLSGTSSGYPLVSLAKADSDTTSHMLGVATHDIENNTNGYITTFGLVRGLNTSGFSGGDIIYLSDATAGAATATKPDNTSHIVRIGYVANAAAAPDGTFLVTIHDNGDIWNTHGYRNTINGFEDPSNDAQISFVNGTRTFTIEPQATEFRYWSEGILYEVTAADDIVIADTEGLHYIYYDGDTLTETTTWSDEIITKYAIVAIVHWDATNSKQIYLADEFLHTADMAGITHEYLHETIGFALETGGGLTDILSDQSGDLDTHAEFGNEATIAWDEDAMFSYTARTSTSNIAVYYKTGAEASNIWRIDETASFGVLTTGTGRAAYNELTGGNWQQTEVTNNNFVLAHVFTYNDSTRKFGVVQGENEYANISAARDGAEVEIASITLAGAPVAEIKFIGTIIYQTSDGYANAVKSRIRTTNTGDDYIDLRDFGITRGGVSGTLTDHGALTGLGDDDHCFSEDTELLTENGFIPYEEIEKGQKALTLNLETNELEYNEIQEKYVYDSFDEMISFKNRYGEILVTPQHKMIYRNTCKEEKNPKSKWLTCTAEEALEKSVFEIPVSGHLEGETFDKPLEFFELLGLIISEGNFIAPKEGGYGIRIYQKENQAAYIENILKKLDVPYTRRTGQTEVFYIRSAWARENIRTWITEKRISDKLMKLRGKQFRAFLSGLIYGDGSKRSTIEITKEDACRRLIDNFDGKVRYSYHSGDVVLKDQLCQLCTFNGLKAYDYYREGGFKNGCWTINITNKEKVLFGKGTKNRVDYSGDVWCVSVPNKTLVLRRNGFIFIAGNTQYLLADGTRALAGAWDMGSQAVTNANIDSGAITGTTIDNCTIGGSTPAAGTFSTVTDTSRTQHAVAIYGASGVLSEVTPLTDGQLVIGSTGNAPVGATLTAGAGISVTNASGSITITNIGGSFSWTTVTGATQSLVAQNGYVGSRATDITYTLPATASVGDTFIITNIGVGKTIINQNASQLINYTASSTTTGVGGSLSAVEQFASIQIVCSVTNTTFNVTSSTGNWTVV